MKKNTPKNQKKGKGLMGNLLDKTTVAAKAAEEEEK